MAKRVREVKRSLYVPKIPGAKVSSANGQLSVSSGIVSLDLLLGGGLPVGSLTVIEEDDLGLHSSVMMKYFLAEGLQFRNRCFLASRDACPRELLKELPKCVNAEEAGFEADGGSFPDDPVGMRIAWRYQAVTPGLDAHSLPSSRHQRPVHDFDLSHPLGEEIANYWDLIQTWNGRDGALDIDDLLKRVDADLAEDCFDAVKKSDNSNVLRLGVLGLGSPLWSAGTRDDFHLFRFLWGLKSRLRRHFAVGVVTLHSYALNDLTVRDTVRQIADCVLRLDSFAGKEEENNPAFRKYHGMLRVFKLPAVNSMASFVPPSLDFAFQLKRKKFLLECFHLPPDLSETVSRTTKDTSKSARSQIGCSSVGGSKLDF